MTTVLSDPNSELLRLLQTSESRVLIGLAGLPGSGKSTLAARWCDEVNKISSGAMMTLGMDGFHLTRAQLAQMPDPEAALARRGAPWTFDADALSARLHRLHAAAGKEAVEWPDFQHEIGDPIEGAHRVAPDVRLVLVEGLYLLHQADGWRQVGENFDQKWYLDTPMDVATERLTQRHMRVWNLSRVEAEARIARNDSLNTQIVAATRANADALIRAEN